MNLRSSVYIGDHRHLYIRKDLSVADVEHAKLTEGPKPIALALGCENIVPVQRGSENDNFVG